MKKKLSICKDCGYEEIIEIYDREEAEKRRLRLIKPRCAKCGSVNIKVVD
jgi:uncharacterized Zn finger protein